MKQGPQSTGQQTGTVIEIGKYEQSVAATRAARSRVRVMVEVASNDPIGENVRTALTRHLEDIGNVAVSSHRPDWVFSLIAFPHGNLVELSVVLRKFFRSTAPGTEMAKSEGSDKQVLREGGWVYESLRFHGLYGVPKADLGEFMKGLAREFVSQHLKRVHPQISQIFADYGELERS